MMRSFRTTNDVIGVIGHNTQSSPALGPVDLAACISIYSTPGLLRLSDYPLFKKITKEPTSQPSHLHTWLCHTASGLATLGNTSSAYHKWRCVRG